MQSLPNNLIGFKVLEELPLQQTLEEYKNHRRLKVFYNKGLTCYLCESRVATRAVKTMDAGGGIHIDLFTDGLILMNVDHIKPKAKGGTNILRNLAPSCCHCNSYKQDMLLKDYKKTQIYQERLHI